jgi:FKBP-type peptidyl-prolyl cis-trans isomerase FkpA
MSIKKTNILLIVAFVSLFAASCKNENSSQEQSALPYSVVKKLHQQELLDWNKGLVSIDYSVIQKYIERRKWDMQVTESGLYWQLYSQTDDIKAKDGLIALFSYKTSLLDGTLVYTSDEFGNRELHLGHNQEELGLNEGIMMMKKGEKARFIMPPHLAFGVPGDGFRVPYYSVLVYEIEILDFYSPEKDVELEDGWH